MKFFQLIPPDTNIDFIGKFKFFMGMSVILLGAVISGIFSKGLNYGIDFTGGVVMQVKFKNPRSAEEVRKILYELGEADASAMVLGTDNAEYLITTRRVQMGKEAQPLNARLIEKIGKDAATILSMDMVGPKVGSELKGAALRSLIYSIILITVYIWFRFDFRFAPGATIAMLHDLLMATGFYLVTGREFTITAIAALLTIAGYSVNDTIVIYDRVRELIKKGGEAIPLPETINKAINLTLSRTLLTSGVTLLSVIPIVIFCTGEIQNFAFAIGIGIIVGSYSTIYIASPFTLYVQRFMERKSLSRPAPA